MKKALFSINAPKAIGPYSQAIEANGFVFLSGQIPLDKDGNIVPGGIEGQTQQALKNIENILIEAGLTKSQIVKSTIFLKDMNDFAKVNEVYGKFFENTVSPAPTHPCDSGTSPSDCQDVGSADFVKDDKKSTVVFPARSTVEVARLPKDVLVEIEVIAVR